MASASSSRILFIHEAHRTEPQNDCPDHRSRHFPPMQPPARTLHLPFLQMRRSPASADAANRAKAVAHRITKRTGASFQWVSNHSTAYVSSPADTSVRTSRTSSFIAFALHEFLAKDLDARWRLDSHANGTIGQNPCHDDLNSEIRQENLFVGLACDDEHFRSPFRLVVVGSLRALFVLVKPRGALFPHLLLLVALC